LDYIKSKVTFLNFGKCPNCEKTRLDFWDSGEHLGKQELIGVAGQRCLDPDLPVLMGDGSIRTLRYIRKGDTLADRLGGVTEVTKAWEVEEPGYFKVYIRLSGQDLCTIRCGHEHAWVTRRGLLPSSELTETDAVEFGETWAEIVQIEKFPGLSMKFVDLETSTGTFLHANGLTLHNSGKTLITAVLSTYILHRFLGLEGIPCARYGLRNTVLMGTFVAGDNKQVGETTWGNFAAEIDTSPWYKTYFALLKEEGKRIGVELYKYRPEYALAFNHKKLLFSHATGDFTGLRGRTRVVGSIDELGWFENREGAKRRAGLEIYTALNNSLRTIRSASEKRRREGQYDLPTAYMFNVSSPMAEDDPIMTLKSRSGNSPKTYCFHHPTWEINPEITLESLAEDLEKDPVKVMRDFEAQPARTIP
jgi:hypothetical protein